MLVFIAKLLAHVAFPFARPFAFVRQNRTLLSLVVVTVIATVFATLGATAMVDRRGEEVIDSQDASALGSFISASGTTTNEWLLTGATGPGLSADAGEGGTISLNGNTVNVGPA